MTYYARVTSKRGSILVEKCPIGVAERVMNSEASILRQQF